MPETPARAVRAPRRPARLSAAVAASVLLATGAAACSSSSSGSSAASSGGRTVITVWDQTKSNDTAALNSMIAAFNASQTKYTVKRQFIAGGQTQFTPSILNAVRDGQAPNVVLNDSTPASMGQIIQTGKVVDLDDVLGTGSYPLAKSDFSSGMLAASTFDGKLYSLPTEGGDYAVVYNKQMFAAAGISQTPTTWADFAADAQKLTKGGVYGAYLPLGTGEWPVFVWESMLLSAGGQLLSSDDTKAAFNSPAGVTALSAWTSMINNGSAYPHSLADTTQSQGEPGFDAKKVAMFIGEVYNIKSTQAALGAADVGVFPLPALGASPAMEVGTNVSFMLDGTAAQNAGAWAFLSWFHQPKQQAQWAVAAAYLPTNLQAEKDPVWTAYAAKNPLISVFANELSYASTRPSITAYAEVSSDLNTAINQAMTQHVAPQSALNTAATGANSALAGQ